MKRPIRIEGDVAYVTLTKGYVAVLDAADVPLVDKWNWCAHVDGRTVYAERRDYSGSKPRTLTIHRAILGRQNGLVVDHIDGDGLNNRRSNLRLVTHQQNTCNQRVAKNNASGRKGVSWKAAKGQWVAQIMLNGRRSHLGYFNCPTGAHFAYVKASRELHGEFGRVA